MRGRRDRYRSRVAGSALVAAALLVVGVVAAQDPAAAPKGAGAAAGPAPQPPAKEAPAANPKGKAMRKGGLRTPGREPNKGVRKAIDPLANPVVVPDPAAPAAKGEAAPATSGTFRTRFKASIEGSEPLAMAYYPSKLGNSAPAVMLIHERDRSSKDFIDLTVAELKGLTLPEYLQKQGYAVLVADLRGHGANPRRNLSRSEWASVPGDIQTAYTCLVDRHNWGELNVAKLGVVAIGEGANVASAWVAGGGGVSSEGRAGDLGALVLVSPTVESPSPGLDARRSLTSLAARIPIDLLVGERDAASFGLVDDRHPERSIRPILKRYRTNQVETFPSALHGYQLFRLEPNLTGSIVRFLEGTIKSKGDEWEGRYLFTPVTYAEVKVTPNPVRIDPATKKPSQ